MAAHSGLSTRKDLQTRRSRLQQAITRAPGDPQLARLLGEVDAALDRLDDGTYGLCEECREPIESERLDADPLLRFCLDHLPPSQQQALEEDLQLASKIQAGLLPRAELVLAGWEAAYHYEAAGVVSGDYCDLVDHDGSLYFVLGDVSGKGVAAAMLMAHLQATFRSLVSQDLPLDSIMERASRVFCESTLSTFFATLICGRAEPTGRIVLSSAGHDPALVSRGSDIGTIDATGLPLGMFCDEKFSTTEIRLEPGDSILLYTDGLTEAVNPAGDEYGIERLVASFRTSRTRAARETVAATLRDLESFRAGSPTRDDLTILVVRRPKATQP